MRRALSLAVAASLTAASVGRADEPPRPPEGRHVWPLTQGGGWTAPAGGGICLDRPGYLYQVERVRYYEARIATAESYAEGAAWRWMLAGLAAGLAAGATVALVRGR